MKFEKVFQKGREHYLKGHTLRRKAYSLFCKVYFHCDIPFQTDIDASTYFCHNAFGVIINPNAKILGGVIQNGVLIGELDDSHASPIIESGVFIGAKAILLGPIRVGKNAKIGAGAVVLSDVPAGCTAVGNPAHIIDKQEELQ